ncbi:MAG: MFS transporter, partial [Candidatus Binatia bacterium]
MSKSEPSALRRYGLIGLAFIHLAASRGIRGTFGVFYVALLEAFGWSRGATAGALSLSIIIEGLSLPFVGSLTDRLGGRRTLILGGIVLVLGLGLSATISSLWELYLWVGIVTALGLGLIGMVPHVAIIVREFSVHRGKALGLAYAGGGVGILFLVPLSAIMIGTWGWSMAYVGLAGLMALLVIPPVQFFTPASSPPVAPVERTEKGTDWTVGRALRSSAFWFLFGSRVLASTGNQIVVTHQ